jgi:sortase A
MSATLVEPGTAPPPPRPRPRTRHRWVPLLLVLIGVGVLVYPVIATEYNNVRQQEFADSYRQQVESAGPDALAADLARAREYNAGLPGVPILDPWLTSAQSGSADYDAYLSQLNRFEVMARLRVPSIGVDLPVRHGTADDALDTGVGHLYGTALPVGGEGSHTVLTGHTGLPDATLFDRLTEVEVGDVFYIDVSGETLAYQVDEIDVVLPEETDKLVPVAGEDLATLVTCTPYSVNSHRLLVRGHRIPYNPAVDAATEPNRRVLQPWMYWSLGAAAGCLLVTAVIAVRSRRRREPATA